VIELRGSQEIKGVYTAYDSGKSCQAGSKHRLETSYACPPIHKYWKSNTLSNHQNLKSTIINYGSRAMVKHQ